MQNKAEAFREKLNHDFIFFDGSMGALLQSMKINTAWKTPEQLLLTEPEVIKQIHCSYFEAGADVILTNSFGANKLKLAEYGLDAQEIVEQAVSIARDARDSNSAWKDRFIAFDIGPTGKLLEPMGSLSFDEAYSVFAEVAVYAEKAGADLVAIETMSDLYELKAAILAVKENTKLPIVATATFQDNNLMLTGAKPKTLVAVLEGLGVDVLGFNCGSSLEHARQLTAEFLTYASIPIFVEPNAGIPVVENEKTVFKVEPQEFAEHLFWCAQKGARVLGGCCGTRPEHIKAVVDACSSLTPLSVAKKQRTLVTSWAETVEIGSTAEMAVGSGMPVGLVGVPTTANLADLADLVGPVIIGERINPTGKKKFKDALLNKDTNYILSEAQKQLDAGSHILDVNVGLPGIDEAEVMCQTVRLLQQTYPCPLQIDSSEPEVLEKALRYYNGKALVNSVNGKQSVMHEVFPLIQKYGGVVVALCLDEQGIPNTAEGRYGIAKKIVETAASYGIQPTDILVDTLTMTVSSQQKEAMETVKAIPLIKKNLRTGTVLGVSNISFGLPQREILTSVFFGAALEAGLDACIINPLSEQMMAVYRSYRALHGLDENCLEYIDYYSKVQIAGIAQNSSQLAPSQGGLAQNPQGQNSSASTLPPAKTDALDVEDLRTLILQGKKNNAYTAAEKLLKTHDPVQIIDEYIVPALDEVGRDYEKGRKFLPQLLMSAETVAQAFEAIKTHLAQTGASSESKGTILIATVSGDIHDIGKNIVKAMLENYGYTVIDLGKDVPIEVVVKTALHEKPGIIGLSALMTTTVLNMEKTITALREAKITSPIMVGGAVLTEDYAYKIGADYYAKDAMASVRIAKKVFGA